MMHEEPRGDSAPPGGSQPRIGTTLLILDETTDMQAVVLALKARGLRPVMMPLAEDGNRSSLAGIPIAEGHRSRCLQLLVPVEPDEIAEGARLVIGPPSSVGCRTRSTSAS